MDWMNAEIAWLDWTGVHLSPWKLIGLSGALMFGARWLVQFLATRRAGRPVIPRLFWIMSLIGSAMTLAYFLFSAKQDAVGVIQNLFPAFTAAYSLCLDIRHQRESHRSNGKPGVLVPSPLGGPRGKHWYSRTNGPRLAHDTAVRPESSAPR